MTFLLKTFFGMNNEQFKDGVASSIFFYRYFKMQIDNRKCTLELLFFSTLTGSISISTNKNISKDVKKNLANVSFHYLFYVFGRVSILLTLYFDSHISKPIKTCEALCSSVSV